jgi:fluoride ion exporter CrcB/FEX
MGTFVANIIGTIILSVIVLLQSGAVSLTVINCDILQALVDGFCGCLTTISTFMVSHFTCNTNKI